MKLHPLELPEEQWQSRWLVLPESELMLHRVAHRMHWHDADKTKGLGYTLCGLFTDLVVPEEEVRTTRLRCDKCCKKAGVPLGIGSPHDKGIKETK